MVRSSFDMVLVWIDGIQLFVKDWLTDAKFNEGFYRFSNSKDQLAYANRESSLFAKSILGNSVGVVALCEVINLPKEIDVSVDVNIRNSKTGKNEKKVLNRFLKSHSWCFTLTTEQACIVRFVLVNLANCIDVLVNMPTNLPSLADLLEVQAKETYVNT